MPRPDEKQPGFILCIHCGSYEGKVACRGCHYLVCGDCAMRGCPVQAPPQNGEGSRAWLESVTIDPAARTISCDGDVARLDAVLEVVAEVEFAGWGDLHYEYRVRIVLGDRQNDFLAVRIRSLNPMKDLDALVTARGEALARALGVKLRVERAVGGIR
jgi:hypothetical protein